MEGKHGCNIKPGKYITVENNKRAIQILFGVFHRSSSAKRAVFQSVVQLHSQSPSIAKMLPDNIRQIAQSQDYLRNTVLVKIVYGMFQKRMIEHRQHGFGDTIGERSQSCTFTANQDNHFLQLFLQFS